MTTDLTNLRDWVWQWTVDAEWFCQRVDASDRLGTQQRWNECVDRFRPIARFMDEAGELTGDLRPLWASCCYMQARGHDGSGVLGPTSEVNNPAELRDIASQFAAALTAWLHADPEWLPPGERPPKPGHQWRGVLSGGRYILAELPCRKEVTR